MQGRSGGEPGAEHVELHLEEGKRLGVVHPHRTAEDDEEWGARVGRRVRRAEALHHSESGPFQRRAEAGEALVGLVEVGDDVERCRHPDELLSPEQGTGQAHLTFRPTSP